MCGCVSLLLCICTYKKTTNTTVLNEPTCLSTVYVFFQSLGIPVKTHTFFEKHMYLIFIAPVLTSPWQLTLQRQDLKNHHFLSLRILQHAHPNFSPHLYGHICTSLIYFPMMRFCIFFVQLSFLALQTNTCLPIFARPKANFSFSEDEVVQLENTCK